MDRDQLLEQALGLSEEGNWQAAAELLRDAVLARSRADGATNVPLFLPEWSPWFARFQEWGWVVFPTAYYHVGRSFDPRYDIRWLRENWWFTLADSDLV